MSDKFPEMHGPGEAAPMPIENGRVLLAIGEATGHHHSVPADCVAVLDEDRFEVKEACEITHQEHNPFTLPPGTYSRGIIRERDALDEIRRVAD